MKAQYSIKKINLNNLETKRILEKQRKENKEKISNKEKRTNNKQSTNYRYYVYGRIGDGTIGIKAIEDLTNGKTDVEAYINNNAITYYHQKDYYDDSCRRRRLRGLLRALCGRWRYNAYPINVPQKLKSIFKSY